MQDVAPGPWLGLGVDASNDWLPDRLRPGVGLRPGGERPDLEDDVVRLYRGLFDSVAVHARLGFDVAMDVGMHDVYSEPRRIARQCAVSLMGLPTLFVGVHCAAVEIWRRRAETWGQHRESADVAVRDAVARWPGAVHVYDYDLEIDTTRSTPEAGAGVILDRLRTGPDGTALVALGPT